MHRSTPSNTAFRAFSGGGSRVLVDKADDDKQMQEGNKCQGQHSEQWNNMEAPQNYGFTSVVHPADKNDDGQIESSAEGHVSFAGGNRSFPIMGNMDDRRHRMKEAKPGDSGMNRGAKDRQQFHMTKDANYMTCRNDRKQRMALVPKEEEKKEGGGGRSGAAARAFQFSVSALAGEHITPSEAEARALGSTSPEAMAVADGGGGSSGGAAGGKGGGKEKLKGQKPAFEDNEKSDIAFEQNGKENFHQHGQYYSSTRGGSDVSNYYENRKKSSQATENHVHMRYEDFKIWVDKEGHWSEMPIMQKKDKHCKE
jgi:hypothetical protein